MSSDPRRLTALLLVLGLAGASACGGNYSNEDIEFLNALPVKEELAAKLPEDMSQSGRVGQLRQGLSLGETADFYSATRDATTSFNGMLDNLLGLIEGVRQTPPTRRTADSRIWGPFPLENPPGFLAQLILTRASETEFVYQMQIRKNAAGTSWTTLWQGSFQATGGVRKGVGAVALDAAAGRAVGFAPKDLEQLVTLVATYRTQAPPLRVDMAITLTPGSSPEQVLYQYREQPDAEAALAFAFVQGGQALQLVTQWRPDGAGRGRATVLQGPSAGAIQEECWDASFALEYLSQSWAPPAQGDASACPAVQPWTE